MATEKTLDQVKDDLHRAMDRMRTDLTRVEILTAALSAFSRPVPEYEPAFRHLLEVGHGVQELNRPPRG